MAHVHAAPKNFLAESGRRRKAIISGFGSVVCTQAQISTADDRWRATVWNGQCAALYMGRYLGATVRVVKVAALNANQ